MASAELRVEVAYCPRPGEADLRTLHFPPGATLADALQASGMLQAHGLQLPGLRVGIWGKLREPATVLRDLDRVEIYRPLLVDPKEARRQRYKRHLEKTAAR